MTPGRRTSRSIHHLKAFLQDVRHGVRALSKAPVFTGAVVMSLALGIGASVAIFSVVNAVLLRPLPYPDPDSIVALGTSSPAGPLVSSASPMEFNFLREQPALQDVSAYRFGRVNMTGGDHPEQIRSALVTAGYFHLFGQKLALGRTFTPEEDRPEGAYVVVLSSAFWMRAFGGDPGVVGQEIFLGGKPTRVIGVLTGAAELPAAFAPEGREPVDVWIPFRIDLHSADQNQYFGVNARLKPGVGLGMVRAQLQVATVEFRRRFPTAGISPKAVLTAVGLRDYLVRGEGSYLSVFAGAVALLLLIACANVANLSLIRASGRKHETAIRAAVGAGRGRILCQLLTESALLSLAGGTLGLVLGMVGIRLLLALNTVGLPRIGDHGSAVTADWRVLGFTSLVALATCLLFGLIPALQFSRADWSEALKESYGRSGSSRRQARARSLLVSGELALALVLVVGSSLLIRSFIALRSVNPGFDTHRLLILRVSLSTPRFSKSSAVADLVRGAVQRIGAIPGVVAASSTCCLPFGDNLIGGVIIRGRPLTGRDHGMVDVTTISPRYFDALRIPIVHGRAFTDRDVMGTAPVVIINQAMARRYWPGDDTYHGALLASLEFPDVPQDSWQIIGIAGDVHNNGLSQNASPAVYFPVAQAPEDLNAYIVRSPVAWMVRTLGEPGSLRLAIQKELIQATGGLPVSGVRTMDEILAESTDGRKFTMLLLTIFGGSALLLAAIGIYGLMSYSVQLRTLEIGIRLALGANADRVRIMVIWQGMRVAWIGVAIGCVVAFDLAHLIAGFLFGVKPRDPVVFVLAPVLLSTVALVSVWLPARRASRIDPIHALRHE